MITQGNTSISLNRHVHLIAAFSHIALPGIAVSASFALVCSSASFRAKAAAIATAPDCAAVSLPAPGWQHQHQQAAEAGQEVQ